MGRNTVIGRILAPTEAATALWTEELREFSNGKVRSGAVGLVTDPEDAGRETWTAMENPDSGTDEPRDNGDLENLRQALALDRTGDRDRGE